ncbi:MAG: tRNA (adenosine(37)-N6)-threonylcarbamoyltransferase complex ATPase subunit type 1 TsaE [Gemmatimonadetes bacterium]|nr:tRNA (adenosine(37)-N6)-threonylcarbamoyltransferase complex ATPase subunit type 1 TsaE [Gemmatimonadota bacterium]
MTLDELEAFGAAIGRAAAASLPCVITLGGDLGAGKTTLTRAIGRGFGVVESVTSPTFALAHEYHAAGTATLFHLDLYRINGPHELANIGWDVLDDANGLVVIEWPDRAGHLIPADALAITLAHVDGDETRRRVVW